MDRERMDKGLAFLLQYENIAWYEPGRVRILDRRVYPYQLRYVDCFHYKDVAQAITDMVTQSGGPYFAAAMGMALAAEQALGQAEQAIMPYLEQAAYTLSHARPTTSAKMVQIVNKSLEAARQALLTGGDLVASQVQAALDDINERYQRIRQTARFLVGQFPEDGVVMTQCFAETILGMMLLECGERNKNVRFICPETRPYLQGARLTSSVIHDMGYEVHVITDNMPGFILKEKQVDLFTSAADVICMDGHVVNKVGTFQIALAAHYWGIPYFVTGTPNLKHPTIDTVAIEERDPLQVLEIHGIRSSKEAVGAYYPAFDITPPTLCSGVVTDRGIYSPYDLWRFAGKERPVQAQKGKTAGEAEQKAAAAIRHGCQ